MVTLLALRQALGYATGSLHMGTVTAPGTTTVGDAALADGGGSDDQYVGSWLLVNGEERRIAGFDTATGVLTLGRALDTAPTLGDEYELHRLLAPSEWTRCINRALSECYRRVKEIITPVSAQTEYPLADYTWLIQPEQVQAVRWRYGDTEDQYHYNPARWWEVTADDGALALRVRPLSASGTFLVLEGLAPYEALTDDADETACPQDWIEAGAEVEAYRLLGRADPAQDATRYKQQFMEASVRLHLATRRYGPMARIRVQHPDAARQYPTSNLA